MPSVQQRDRTATSDIDPFSRAFLADPYRFHEQLRELGAVVRLPHYDVWAVTRYDQVSIILNKWEIFGSGGGVGIANFHKEGNWRPPSLLRGSATSSQLRNAARPSSPQNLERRLSAAKSLRVSL